MTPINSLTKPIILYSRSAVLSKPSLIPAEPGLYAWFFKEIPGITPTDGFSNWCCYRWFVGKFCWQRKWACGFYDSRNISRHYYR